MNRMHIHVGVDSLEQGITFYRVLFGADPIKVKSDYAKWMLEDPRINFAISTRLEPGVDHLGLQVDENQELNDLRERLHAAELSLFDEGETRCCYARSEKTWVRDPAGIAWEAFNTLDDAETFDGGTDEAPSNQRCCANNSPQAGQTNQMDCCAGETKTARTDHP